MLSTIMIFQWLNHNLQFCISNRPTENIFRFWKGDKLNKYLINHFKWNIILVKSICTTQNNFVYKDRLLIEKEHHK